MRLSLRPGRGSAGRGGGEQLRVKPGPHGAGHPPGKAPRVGLIRAQEEGRAGQDPPGKFLGRYIPFGGAAGEGGYGCVTVQGSKRGFVTVSAVGVRGTERPRVSSRLSQRWELPNHCPALGSEGGDLLTPPTLL